MTDVAMIVDAHAQIRSLNLELAKKNKLTEDLKTKIQHFTSKKSVKDFKQDEDVVEYLVNIVKEKDKANEEFQFKIAQLVVRLFAQFIVFRKENKTFRRKWNAMNSSMTMQRLENT